MPRSSGRRSLPIMSSDQNVIYIFPSFPCVLHASLTSYSLLNHPNNTSWSVQVISSSLIRLIQSPCLRYTNITASVSTRNSSSPGGMQLYQWILNYSVCCTKISRLKDEKVRCLHLSVLGGPSSFRIYPTNSMGMMSTVLRMMADKYVPKNMNCKLLGW